MSGQARVDIILCGVGRMGRHHLRALERSVHFRLRAIVDPRSDAELGVAAGVPRHPRVEDVPDDVFSAAIVASPSATHHPIARALLERGKALLIEKPLALGVAPCRELGAVAARAGVKVAVGHVERFNPAIRRLRALLLGGHLGAPVHLGFTRVGGRDGARADVLTDLAVHDLDLLEWLAGPAQLLAAVEHGGAADLLLRAGDASASVHVDARTRAKVRAVELLAIEGAARADLVARTLTVRDVRVDLTEGDPLSEQLAAFAGLLRGEATDLADLAAGTRAVELAEQARARVLELSPRPG